MFSNYLKIALRSLLRSKGISLINIVGLAIGIAATLLILLYIKFESSYDSFHSNAQNLYRVSIRHLNEGRIDGDSPEFTPPLGPAMAEEIPGVEAFTRISSGRNAYLSYGDRSTKLEDLHHADSSFFQMFSFDLLAGSPETVLKEPYTIVLTEQAASRVFHEEDPLGKTVYLNGTESYVVAGIAKNPPANSHIRFSALISFSTLYKNPNLFLDWDGGNQYITYVKLHPDISSQSIGQNLSELMGRGINARLASIGVRLDPYLQPLTKIHLYHSYGSESARTNLAVFAVIAVLLLLIACVNYVNLTTARAVRRMKEIGVRKVLGAHRRMLMQQFLSESFAVSMVALFLALLLMELSFPAYRDIVGRELSLPSLFSLETISALTGAYLLVALLGGGYPAWYLSSLRTTETLKGVLRSGKRLGKARSVLVVFQFAVSIGLLVCTGIVTRQLTFSKNMDPGFQKEGMIVLPLVGENVKTRGSELQRALSSIPGVMNVAASSEVPSDGFTRNGYFPEQHETPMMIHVLDVDERFLSTYDIQLVRGRNFSQEIQSDKSTYLVNESLVKRLGWEDPIGKKIVRNGTHTIIGVVKDFHYATLHSDLEPLIITNQPWLDRFSFLSVRIMPGDIPERLAAIRSVWTDVAPDAPFDYWFLDDAFDQLYRSEQQFQKLFGAFSLLTVAIALLGLLSLAAFATEQRTKEIGVRKVLGASVVEICSLLTKEFVLLVLLANVFAWPVSYYAMSRWLEDFAYRVDIGWWVFVLAGGVAMVIALLTVSFQAVRAAVANPVEALRYE